MLAASREVAKLPDPRRAAAPAEETEAGGSSSGCDASHHRSPDLLGAALAYSERGWPVFPCEPGGKRPLGALVPHGLKDATTDAAIIREWWGKCPTANTGLPTGQAFDVLDVDRPKPGQPADGQVTLWELVAEHGPLPAGPTVLTPSDGLHLYFAPTGLGNRAGLRPGLDYRGVGGYVLAPPSVLADGTAYTWLTTPLTGVWAEDRDDPDPDPADGPMFLSAPAWLVELLAPTSRPTMAPGDVRRPDGAVGKPGDRRAAYGRTALDAEKGRVALAPPRTGNDQLNRSAHALGQLVAGGALDLDEVMAVLLAADAVRGGRSEAEARRTIASGLRAGMRQPRSVPA